MGITQQLLNRQIAERAISKQEALTCAAGLNLVLCTEIIQPESLSSVSKCTSHLISASNSFFKKYKNRDKELEHLSPVQFFQHIQETKKTRSTKKVIPFFIGANGQPTYPPSESYARTVLLLHTSWRRFSNIKQSFIPDFLDLICSPNCPKSVRIAFERVRQRSVDYKEVIDATSHTKTDIDNDSNLQDLLLCVPVLNQNSTDGIDSGMHGFNIGINYAWDARTNTVRKKNTKSSACRRITNLPFILEQIRDAQREGGNWLKTKLDEHEDEGGKTNNALIIPKKSDGSGYCLKDLTDEQKLIVYIVLKTLRNWWMNDKKYRPLRMTIAGRAGTGKSRIINTIITILRKMFQDNNVIHVAAPTGSAAHNIGGRTLHRLFGIKIHGNNKLSKAAENRMMKLFLRTLAIVIDERSMLSCELLGLAERNTASCAHGGRFHQDEEWGGVPIVLLVGDDYQLPPLSFYLGAFDILEDLGKTAKNLASVRRGAEVFLICSLCVVELQTVHRQGHGQDHYLKLLDNARKGNLTDEDIDHIMKLHLSNVPREKRNWIEKNAVFIFATKAPMMQHNNERLRQISSENNPVAVITSKTSRRSGTAEGISSHFDNDNTPASTMLCVGAVVALCGRNISPEWGLFNNAMGIVDEIVYDVGCSPFTHDMPLYVAVRFQEYCGPQWDPFDPKVRTTDRQS